MTKKAVILELDSSNVTLFSEEGEFISLPAPRLPQARYIGQNINLDQIKPTCKLGWVPLLTACFFVLLLARPLLIPSPAMAWVSLDNSSSLELLVDNRFKIQEIRPLNNGASNFLADCQEESLTFHALVEEFIDWSVQNGDNSLLVTATGDIQAVKTCLCKFANHNLQVVTLEVDPQVRDEAGRMGLSAGRALFMAEASCQGVISPEKIKNGNPIAALDSAGINLEAFVSSLNVASQAEKIKDLPSPAQETPEGNREGKLQEDEPSEPAVEEQTGEGNQGTNLPPGLAKKDKNHPGVQLIGRSGSWGKRNNVPRGRDKADKEKNEVPRGESGQPAPGGSENGKNANKGKDNPGKGKHGNQGKPENPGKGKEKDGGKEGQDQKKSKGNSDPAKNKQGKQKGLGHDNRDKKNNGKNGKP